MFSSKLDKSLLEFGIKGGGGGRNPLKIIKPESRHQFNLTSHFPFDIIRIDTLIGMITTDLKHTIKSGISVKYLQYLPVPWVNPDTRNKTRYG